MWNILETQQILFEYVRLCGVCVCSVSVVYMWGVMGVGVGDVEGRMALILLVELGGKS